MIVVSLRKTIAACLFGLFAFALVVPPCFAEEKFFGDAEKLTQLLADKATVVGYWQNTILLLKGTTLYRCEITENLKLGDALKVADGSRLIRYKSRGCGKIFEEE